MKALQATCIVGAIAFAGMIHQVGGNTPGATVPDAMPEAAVSAETPGTLSAAVPEASAGPGTALGAELGSVPGAVSGPSLMAKAEIGADSIETKSVDLGHHDAAQPVPDYARCVRRCLQPGAGDAGFPISHLLRLVRTAACREHILPRLFGPGVNYALRSSYRAPIFEAAVGLGNADKIAPGARG